jgi:predicted Fe-Mo cluster-binding NifX family protein
MKICITAKGDNLESAVESRFGRSPYFIIYDTGTSDFEAIENPNLSESSGVGIKAGQMMAKKGVKVTLTGGKVGPKATAALEAAGIEVIADNLGTVKEAIDKYQSKEFDVSKNATLESKESKEQQEVKIAAVPEKNSRFGRGNQGGGQCGRAGSGGGFGQGRGKGRGRQGSGGKCICPKCGEKIAHQQGTPCRAMLCPECKATMIRE